MVVPDFDCGLLAGAGTMLFHIARRSGFHALSITVLVGLFGLDAKTVDFSINGQETAFMMIFMALMLQALTVRSRWTILKLGLGWAGLMWTRPDAFIYFGTVALGFLIFNAGKSIGLSRAGLFKVLLGAGAITTYCMRLGCSGPGIISGAQSLTPLSPRDMCSRCWCLTRVRGSSTS